ncbi:hypothetical protein GVN18_18685 [Pseudomonas sp. ODNR1LW]|nr:hypothetical protein [Pseudomonas sp. ODNR1LW]
MKIILSPSRRDDTLTLVKDGDRLIINGETFDFSPLGEGDTLPSSAIASNFFLKAVDRIKGELELTLILPNPWNASHEQLFPVPLFNVPDGPVALPQAQESAT